MNGIQESQKSEYAQSVTAHIGTKSESINRKRPKCECGCGEYVKRDYQNKRWKRFATNHHTKIFNYDPFRKCVVDGCERTAWKKTLLYCNKHYLQMRRHGKILKKTMYDRNDFKFKDGLCFIDLYDRKGEFVNQTFIDEQDFNLVKDFKWGISQGRAVCRELESRLSTFLLIASEGFVVDHINRNPLDNRRCNLRICKQSENVLNSCVRSNSKSKAKGVYLRRDGKKWCAYVGRYGKRIHIGSFPTLQKAIDARNEKAKEIHGEFAYMAYQEE